METYIAILIFLFPGFIVSKIRETLGNKKRYTDDLKTISEILGYDVLILAIQVVVLYERGYRTIQQVVIKIGQLNFLLQLTACLVISSIIVGVTIAYIHPKYTGKIVNYVRGKSSKPNVNDEQVWDYIINKGPFMKVYKDDKLICQGNLHMANFDATDNREILLDNGWLLDARPDLFEEKDVQMYYNLDKDIVIKVYDPANAIAESKKYTS